MRIGADKDGREIVYGETEGWLKIGGIPTSIDRIIAYDQKGQIDWASDETKAWAYEFYKGWQAHQASESARTANEAQQAAAQRTSAARRQAMRVVGHDPSAAPRLAGVLKGLATAIIIVSTLMGAVVGLVLGRGSGSEFLGVILIGGLGFFVGYLETLMLKAIAEMLLATAQIEVNTRPAE